MTYNEKNWPAHFAEKYKNIPYVFLDVPKIEVDDNFHEVWNEFKKPILRLKPDARDPRTPEEAAEYKRQNPGWTNQWVEANWDGIIAYTSAEADDRWTESRVDGYKLFPKFFQAIHDLLPVRKVSQVLFWSNVREIGMHRDMHEQLPFPSSIRMMIEDHNPCPTFFLMPVDDSFKTSKVPEDRSKLIPLDTSNAPSNVFMYNNKDYAHGAIKLEGYSKILCSMSLDYDWVKLERMLDETIAKYGNNLPQQ
jgi:hypothetical protein